MKTIEILNERFIFSLPTKSKLKIQKTEVILAKLNKMIRKIKIHINAEFLFKRL
jgi:hypothetical protein